MPGRFKNDIELEEVKGLPLIEFRGEIKIVDNMPDYEKAIAEMTKHKMAGFDTETRPSFKKGVQFQVSLLQVFCGKVCYLIRLNKVGFPESLRAWFEDESITKIGLSLRDDVRELRKKRNIQPKNLIDLQTIVSDYGISALSLKKLSAIVLGSKLSKKQQLSNWESPKLNEKQQIYAATDAWVCLEIYNRLISGK